jgi:HAD superfamily hydrolase (TIGR01459 family)
MTAIIEHAGALFSRYDVLLSDVWGVVHDGRCAYAGAGEAFACFRAQGGTVLLLSNAPMPSTWVERVLDEKGVRRDSWDAIVSSGDIALAHIAARSYVRVLHIGTERDLPLFETMAATRSDFATAEAIVCTGLEDDRTETAETYRPLLMRALQRGLPFVCANPDLMVDVGGDILPCAGILAQLYEQLGGEVYWAGKPFAPAYERAMSAIERLRGSPVALDRVLAIGDAVRTDIAGAGAFGIESVFIGQGIHRHEVLTNGELDAQRLAHLLAGAPVQPIAAMVGVAW